MDRLIQPSFAAGEISPNLFGRIDLAKYSIGLARMSNFFVDYKGGAVSRPGTAYVGTRRVNSESRLIPFQYSTEQTYALEFGHLYMRVIKDGGYVLEPAKIITAITTGATTDVTSTAHGYTTDDWVYITGVVGATWVNERVYRISVLNANSFRLMDLQFAPYPSTGLAAYVSGGNSFRVFNLPTPYIATDLPLLKYTQSNDVMTLTHPSYAARDLSRTDHHVWSLSTITFASSITAPVISSVVIANSSYINSSGVVTAGTIGALTEYDYVVTAVSETDGSESLASNVEGVLGGSFSLNTVSIRITWAAVTGAQYYNIYRARWATGTSYTLGWYSTNKPPVDFGLIGSSSDVTFLDSNIVADFSTTPPKSENPFATDAPAVATYFQQRKFFGATNANPQTFWATQIGAYKNMNKSRPVRATDAIEATLASQQVNAIKHFIPMADGIIVLTASSFWQVTSSEGGISPTTIQAKPQGKTGSSDVVPLVIGNDILFIQNGGMVVRDVAFAFYSDSFVATDLTVLANHLFYGYEIVDWCYAENPFKIIWAVRSDGKLLSCTFLKEQEVSGWAQHETNGIVKSICSIEENGLSAVYIIVQRIVDGETLDFVERLAERLWLSVEEAWAVDAGLRYEGVAVSTVNGLDHLEGETVAILGDGNVHPSQVVTNGSVTLDQPCTLVTVGLSYTCQLQTLPIDAGDPTIQGRRKRIPAVTVRIEKTRGLSFGPDFDSLIESKDRSGEPWGTPIALGTGDGRILIENDWTKLGQVCIEQSYPLPANVLAIIPEVHLGDN